jgi:hypothetical protein
VTTRPFACAILLAATAAPAQEERLREGDKLCGECRTTGKVAFEVPKEVLEQEKGCSSCSEVAAIADLNFGLDYQPCPKCLAPSLQKQVRAEWERDRDRGLDWLKSRREIDAFLDDPKHLKLMHCSTEHFELAWSIPKVKVGRVVHDQHQSMHLYARRLEEAYATWLETFKLDHVNDQNAVRHVIMCFDSAKHANKAQPKYTGMGGTGITDGIKLMGSTSVYVNWWNKTKNRDDDEFHEYVLHNVVHLFLCSYYNYFWLARKNGWVDEGLSHWFTDRRFGKCRTHCFQEQDEASQWILSAWRPEVRKRVAADKLPVFAEVIVKHGETLTAEEHLFVWSWVQYLIDGFGPERFVQLLRGLKEQVPLRDVLQSAYGVSPFQFIENWKKYVIETYPPR